MYFHYKQVMEITREHDRIIVSQRVDFRVSVGETKTTAVIMDYSQGGAKIVSYGESFPVDTTMRVDSERLDLHKKSLVVWNKNIGNSISLTGLQFIS